MRLGELLVAMGHLTPEQCERTLQAQVIHGGRFGTNALELGFIDLDTLTRGLGARHDLPGALARHFDRIDQELAKRLSGKTAERLLCVPLNHVRGAKHGVVIASADPLSSVELAAVANELLVEPDQLIAAIAPEMRIRYYLERLYRVPRSPRFLRLKSSIPPIERRRNDGVPMPVMLEMSHKMRVPVVEKELDDLSKPRTAPEPTGRERRTYAESRARAVPPPLPPKLARASRDNMKPMRLADTAPRESTFDEAMQAIRRATDREQVGALVLDAIARFAPGVDAVALLLMRGDVAIGWKTFSRAHSIADIVVPLGFPGLVSTAADQRTTLSGNADELQPVDQMLLRALDQNDPCLVVTPIAIDNQVPVVIASAGTSEGAAATLKACAAAAGEAFARLIDETAVDV